MSSLNELSPAATQNMFLAGVNFEIPGKMGKIKTVTEKNDGYLIMANPGKNRKYDRHDISVTQFCLRQQATPKHIAIGVSGKDVLFVLDSTLPEHQGINLYVQPSTKIIASKPKVIQLFDVLEVPVPKGADSYTIIAFNLVHMFANIYKAAFNEPLIVNMSAGNNFPGGSHF
jgi:hypothetical protein